MLLSTLKNLLLESKELYTIWEHFFYLLDKGILLKNSQAIPDPTKKDVLVKVFGGIQHIIKEAKIIFLEFSEVPSENFYHGNFSITGILVPCAVFYFSDIDMGSLVYSKNGTNEIFRFSLTKITDPKTLTIH